MEKFMKLFISLLLLSTFIFADATSENQDFQPTSQPVALGEFSLSESLASPNLSTFEIDTTPKMIPKPQKSTFNAVALSMLAPGLGHIYLDDSRTGYSLLGTSALSSSMIINKNTQDYAALCAPQNIWFYSIYAAYRDTRKYNDQAGYRYQMPQDSLSDLTLAPFRFSVLKKPEVWGGVLGCLSLASAVSYIGFSDAQIKPLSLSNSLFPMRAFNIGVGEEAIFRGYIQSFLMERLSPTASIITSSLIFGAAHIGNASGMDASMKKRYYTYSLPLISTLGGYMGWLTHKNHSLKESVAVHAWYDFAVFSAAYMLMPKAAIQDSCFATSFSF
jgi:membrane protease YdiL (CAAX protease family)